MNCLVVTPHRLGIREMAERIGSEWEAMGHDVEYVLARGAAARVGPVTVGMSGIALWWYRTLKRVAADHDRYDLIWTHQPVAPWLPTRDGEFWNKVVATIHTTLGREYELVREGVYPKRLLPFYWMAKTAESRFHRKLTALETPGPHYTVVSPHLADETARFGVPGPTYVPNGVFTPDRSDFEPIRPEHGVPDDATLVFNVGSHSAQKRPETFARLMREVTDRADDVYVAMAGDGPYRKTVDAYANDRLRVLGRVGDDEKWRWFADADVFASLSAYEGMPVATAEALSFDLPVVLSDIPAHRHLLDTYDATGALVDDDADEIADAIMRLSGERSGVSLPTWSDVARNYLELV